MNALRKPLLTLLSLFPCLSVAAQDEFLDSFRKAVEVGDQAAVVELVKADEAATLDAVTKVCVQLAERPSAALEDQIEALRLAWRDVHKTKFVDIQYEYFSLLRPEFRKTRVGLAARYEGEVEKFESGDETKLAAIGVELASLAEAFEEIGDFFMASQAFMISAECFDEPLRGDDADLERACETLRKGLELREKVELTDTAHAEAKVRFDALEVEGYGAPEKGPEARAAARAAADASYAPTPISASFELLDDIAAIRRPNFMADEIYQMWNAVLLQGNGSSARFTAMESSPLFLREGAAKVSVDIDGDQTGDIEIPLGKIAPVEITIGRGDEQRKWGFLATIGLQQDRYQGFAFNLGPDENQMALYLAPAGSIVGMVGDVSVRVIDDNMDGIYGSPPVDRPYIGVRSGSVQSDIDSVVIGDEKSARPWSELQKIGEAWYTVESNETGTDVIVTKTDVETGTLKLDFKGPKVEYLILQGTRKLEHVFVDVAPGGKKGTEVPAGTYRLFAGMVSKGKRDSTSKAIIVPTKVTERWTVEAGGTATVELGAPFGFDFEFSQNDESVQLTGASIVVTGRGKETYQRFWNCVPHPEAAMRKAGSKKGGKGEKLRSAESQDDVTQHNDYAVAWFPYDTAIEKKKVGEEVELQLVEKKNKLFGKVESDWKD